MRKPPPGAALAVGLSALLLTAWVPDGPTRSPSRPVVGFASADQVAIEDQGSARIEVRLSRATSQDVTVSYVVSGSALRGGDYDLDGVAVVIPAGETSAALTLTLLDDPAREETETVYVELTSARGASLAADRVHTLAIQDQQAGGPIDGLTPDELAAFRRGKLVFERRFTQRDGLGPFYNAVSCASCHSTPVTGGAAALYRNFYLAVYYEITPSNQSSAIPPFLSQVVPAYGSGGFHGDTTDFTLDGPRPLIPDTVFGLPVLSAQRNAIPVFGTGLFEAISDATIMAGVDTFDSNGDGITGRINTQLNGAAVGRFGTKAQVNNVELFTRGPLQNQMGITTDPFEGTGSIVSMSAPFFQVSADPNNPTFDVDKTPDPELSRDDLGDLIAFSRFLAPLQKTPFNAAALRGELLFEEINCTGCHVPSLPSSRGPVHAYTDLLIHDMGPDLVDNIRLGDSNSSLTRFRTQPLWGVSKVGPFMHDGRAATLRDAIDAHAGEAENSRTEFDGLSEDEQADVIAFLEHL